MKEFVNELTSSAMFGLALTFLAYALCGELKKRWNNPIFNPLIFALVFICLFLTVTKIPLENYQVGGNAINMMIVPVTCILAVTVYRRLETLKRLWIPVLCGCVTGALTEYGSFVPAVRPGSGDDVNASPQIGYRSFCGGYFRNDWRYPFCHDCLCFPYGHDGASAVPLYFKAVSYETPGSHRGMPWNQLPCPGDGARTGNG